MQSVLDMANHIGYRLYRSYRFRLLKISAKFWPNWASIVLPRAIQSKCCPLISFIGETIFLFKGAQWEMEDTLLVIHTRSDTISQWERWYRREGVAANDTIKRQGNNRYRQSWPTSNKSRGRRDGWKNKTRMLILGKKDPKDGASAFISVNG